ncbi:MAG: hypothetical protein IJM90_00955 [Firmicutes bacterium]|nr:hypothetical protein [Bacillota bacterium]
MKEAWIEWIVKMLTAIILANTLAGMGSVNNVEQIAEAESVQDIVFAYAPEIEQPSCDSENHSRTDSNECPNCGNNLMFTCLHEWDQNVTSMHDCETGSCIVLHYRSRARKSCRFCGYTADIGYHNCWLEHLNCNKGIEHVCPYLP